MNKPEFDDIYMDLAINLSKKSHCVKAHVGAVLTKDTRIISVGYNGPPAGTHNCDQEWPEVGCPRDSKKQLFHLRCMQNKMPFYMQQKAMFLLREVPFM